MSPRQAALEAIQEMPLPEGWASITDHTIGAICRYCTNPKMSGTITLEVCNGPLAGMVQVGGGGIIIVCDRSRLAAAFAHVATWVGTK